MGQRPSAYNGVPGSNTANVRIEPPISRHIKPHSTSTETLVRALRVLAQDIHSDDGVANAAIAEAADRLEDQHIQICNLLALIEENQN